MAPPAQREIANQGNGQKQENEGVGIEKHKSLSLTGRKA
jgi:hypothetical protein